jgi:hypothetical protein
MSIKGTFEAKCPSCGERFEADLWTVIRGDQDARLKEALIGGECDLLMCPACSSVFPCEETFIYMDPGRELMVFVMPEGSPEEKEKLIAKMRLDYETFRGASAKEAVMDFAPIYHFGVGMLSDLLRRDRDIEEETEVMAFMAAERGFKSVAVRAGFARERDIPFSLPCAGCPCRDHALKAVRAILADNDALVRVKNLLNILEKTETQELPFITR